MTQKTNKTLDALLGIQYPLIQGGMAQISTGAFAAAVSNAGGLGLIATGGFSVDEVRAHIATAKAQTNKPFGVNLLLMHHDIKELAQLVIDEGVAAVTTGAGDPAGYMPHWLEAGIKVFPVVSSVALAQRMERYGATAIIAEGTESGGHVGELTTMVLTYAVAHTVGIPVIAAGGIASGAQLCAAFALGAIGAQMGTVLLASKECPVHDNYKTLLVEARDTGTIVTGRSKGAPIRQLKNRMARAYVKLEEAHASREEMHELSLDSLRKAVSSGDKDAGSFMAGQVAGQIKNVRTLAEIFASIMTEYEQTRTSLPDARNS
jgi:enoyl-[acyl-carrier protein] reductase II